MRYRATFEAKKQNRFVLVIDNAAEGVEVFVNGVSAGIQIVPVFRYDLSGLVKDGENELVIEVATTLERQCYNPKGFIRKLASRKPSCGSGITGKVALYRIE